jgi:drug/metabolite transporter, DME family
MTGTRHPPARRASAAGFPLVALSAALWGTDALFRRGLALELPAATVVVYEHLILVAIMLPILLRVPWRRLTPSDVVALLIIGAGASALATGLFTAAFRFGDPNTPLLLQKLQPLVALVGARWLLKERLTPRFGIFLSVALGAAWLITFPDPFTVAPAHAAAGGLAAGAACLWAVGTVLGRRMSFRLSFAELTAARFGIGLPAAVLFALLGPGEVGDLAIGGEDLFPLVLLALVPGLLALLLYYRGLRATPASAATVAELAFPLSALTINFAAFGATLTATQAIGVVTLSATLLVMGYVGRDRADHLGVEVANDEAVTRQGS